MGQVKEWAISIGIIAGFMALAYVLEAPLRPLTDLISRHEQSLLVLTSVTAAIGFVLFMGAGLYALLRPRTFDTIESSSAVQVERRTDTQRRLSRRAEMEFSMSGAEIRRALLSGDWKAVPGWRLVFTIAAGAIIMSTGLIGIFLVVGPLFVKLMMLAMAVYALVLLARALSGD
jgi:hypothetical protein